VRKITFFITMILAVVCFSYAEDTNINTGTVVLIDGIAYCESSVIELRHLRRSAMESISERFMADFRSAVNAYLRILLMHYNNSSMNERDHAALLGRIASLYGRNITVLNREFFERLLRLDATIAQRLTYSAVSPEAVTEWTLSGTFDDFFPPLLRVVTIDGVHYNALAAIVLQEKMAEISHAEWASMRRDLLNIITQQHNRRLLNSGEFAEWYHNFRNRFSRSGRQVHGSYSEYVEANFNERINLGVKADEHLYAISSFWKRADAIYSGLLSSLMFSKVTEDNKSVRVVSSMDGADFFEAHTLTTNIKAAGHLFGLDISGWHNYSILKSILCAGLAVLGVAMTARFIRRSFRVVKRDIATVGLVAKSAAAASIIAGGVASGALVAGAAGAVAGVKIVLLTNPWTFVIGCVIALAGFALDRRSVNNQRLAIQEVVEEFLIDKHQYLMDRILSI